MEAHPGLGGVQPLLVLHRDREHLDSSGVEIFSLPHARDRQIGRSVAEAPEAPEEVFGVCAAAALYRAEAFRQAGLLDDDFFVIYEDVDLCFRMRLAGFGFQLVPAARIYHKRGVSSHGGFTAEKKYILHRNTRALAIRYWPRRFLLMYWPFLTKAWLWGVLHAARSGRRREWSSLMSKSRKLRRRYRKDPTWRLIQINWMRPLGFAYYGRKLLERITGRPAIE
jgi:GT2 family glycosyltransferase